MISRRRILPTVCGSGRASGRGRLVRDGLDTVSESLSFGPKAILQLLPCPLLGPLALAVLTEYLAPLDTCL